MSVRVSTEGATSAIAEAVCSILVMSRPARMIREGECLEIVSANSAPRPPGDTPVIRITLFLMLVERSEAIWSPSVSEVYCDIVNNVKACRTQYKSGSDGKIV